MALKRGDEIFFPALLSATLSLSLAELVRLRWLSIPHIVRCVQCRLWLLHAVLLSPGFAHWTTEIALEFLHRHFDFRHMDYTWHSRFISSYETRAIHEIHELRECLLITSQRLVHERDDISLAPGNHF